MSLFQCQHCGCRENTAMCSNGFTIDPEAYNWDYAPERKGMKLCTACGPREYSHGYPTDHRGHRHDQFPRMFLPKGEFSTAPNGNLMRTRDGNPGVVALAIPRPADLLYNRRELGEMILSAMLKFDVAYVIDTLHNEYGVRHDIALLSLGIPPDPGA